MNKLTILRLLTSTAFLIVPVTFTTVSNADECKPHYKNFDKNTLMGILTLVDKAKTSSKETVINNGHTMVARKTGECTVDIELYDDTNETQMLCKESVNVCLSDNKMSPDAVEAAKTHFENEKIRAKKHLDTLEIDGKEQIEEKERRVQEHLKQHPQVETSDDYHVNDNGDHELIVTFIDNADESSIVSYMEKVNAHFKFTFARKDAVMKLISVTTSSSKKLYETLKKNPNVNSIEFNRVGKTHSAVPVPNDPLYASMWHLSKISAPAAWQISAGNPGGLGVAIIDDGVYAGHPDLAASIMYSNGYSDSHGTNIAGVIAASGNNGLYGTGINWYGKIYAYNCGAVITTTSVINNIYNAAYNPDVKIINLSLDIPNSSSLLTSITTAYNYGKVIIASAGNYDSTQIIAPAMYPYVLSVGGTNLVDNRAYTSNYGPLVNVSAPAEYIVTTHTASPYYTNLFSGTSAAAPMVSGLASLILSVHPSLTNYQVYSIIRNNTDGLPTTTNSSVQSASGRINAYKALQSALAGVVRDFDVNGNGIFSIADSLLTLNKCVDLYPTTQSDLAHGDVHPYNGVPIGNGILDLSDALTSLNKLVGLI